MKSPIFLKDLAKILTTFSDILKNEKILLHKLGFCGCTSDGGMNLAIFLSSKFLLLQNVKIKLENDPQHVTFCAEHKTLMANFQIQLLKWL